MVNQSQATCSAYLEDACCCIDKERQELRTICTALDLSLFTNEPHLVQIEAIIIPMEDELIHTDEHPFCDDAYCPCHLEALREAWKGLQAVPSYVEQQAALFAKESGVLP